MEDVSMKGKDNVNRRLIVSLDDIRERNPVLYEGYISNRLF